jgi:hypothetical protein
MTSPRVDCPEKGPPSQMRSLGPAMGDVTAPVGRAGEGLESRLGKKASGRPMRVRDTFRLKLSSCSEVWSRRFTRGVDNLR